MNEYIELFLKRGVLMEHEINAFALATTLPPHRSVAHDLVADFAYFATEY